MIYSKEVDNMCVVAKGPNHGPAPIPEEGKWIQAKEIKDISGYTHGVGWCGQPQWLRVSVSFHALGTQRAALKPSLFVFRVCTMQMDACGNIGRINILCF